MGRVSRGERAHARLGEFIARSVGLPKYRRRALYGKFRRDVGQILRDLCRQRGVELLEGTLRPDHVHMCLKVAPKSSIAFVIGFLKGKSGSARADSASDSEEDAVRRGVFATFVYNSPA